MSSGWQITMTIFGMAVGTYLTRVAGLFLINRVKVTGRTEAFLKAIPGTILISIVAPTVLTSGPAEALAAVVVAVVAWRSNSLPLAMAVGVAAIWALRQFFG